MKKITILIISLLITFFGMSALKPVFAAIEENPDAYTVPPGSGTENIEYGIPSAPDADDPNKLYETYFPVNKYLTLPGGEQPLQYFEGKANEGDPEGKYSPIVAFIIRIINFATRIIGSIAIILLIITGFMFMFAQGNQQQLDEAKDMLKYTIIGLIVTFLSYIIVIFVQSIFTPI